MTSNRQTGIALITVLLILSLATVAAVSMTTRQQLDIRRTTNMLQIEEAYTVLFAAEEFAKALLLFDAKQTKIPNNTDGPGDYWNDSRLEKAVQSVGNFKLVDFYIEDLQGRFNINNLLGISGAVQAVSQSNYDGFVRLLQKAGLPETLADAAYDWIDANTDQYNDGAEDGAYSALEKAYLTPNMPMASASEINRLAEVNLSGLDDYGNVQRDRRKLIRDMLYKAEQLTTQPKVVGAIPPVVLSNILVALPQGTPINVNTVPSPAIYQMIVPDLGDKEAQELHNVARIIELEHKPEFEHIDDFWSDPRVSAAMSKSAPVPANRVAISVDTHYFLLTAKAMNGDLVVYLNTILYRDANGVKVFRRSYGKLGEI